MSVSRCIPRGRDAADVAVRVCSRRRLLVVQGPSRAPWDTDRPADPSYPPELLVAAANGYGLVQISE